MLRALAFRQGDSGSIPARCLMWVDFVIGCRLASRVFLPPRKPTFQFQFHQDRRPAWKPAKADFASSLYIVNYYYSQKELKRPQHVYSFYNLWKQYFLITYTKLLRHRNDIPLGSTSAISCTSSGIPISWGYFSSYHTRSSAPTEISLKAR